MLPQAKAYRISKDEKYIQSWIETYGDWLATYPYEPGTQFPPAGGSENAKDYEWKGLQVAERCTFTNRHHGILYPFTQTLLQNGCLPFSLHLKKKLNACV